MPELPEVETVARELRPRLEGRRIVDGRVLWARTVGGRGAAFLRAVSGATLGAVGRRAKYLTFPLARDGVPAGMLLGHLRMSGRMHVEPEAAPPGRHARVLLTLDDGHVLHFDDVRKFGRLEHVAAPDPRLAALGPEPLEAGFHGAWLHGALAARRRRLKPLLLDQTFVAGLGNIYVDEALHVAGLHPLRASASVSPAEAERLAGAVRAILTRAVERGGSSFDAMYRSPEGRSGAYQAEFRVYDREGQPCRACATPIIRIVVGQRGTHLCPACQPRRQRVSR